MKTIKSPNLCQPKQIKKTTKKNFKCLMLSKLMQQLSLNFCKILKWKKVDPLRNILKLRWTNNSQISR